MVKIVLQGDLEELYRKDKDKGLNIMMRVFRKAITTAGILTECKRREFYESPGEKARRKKKESIRERVKNQEKKEVENKWIGRKRYV